MALALHNTMTGQLEVFKPLKQTEVRMYACGFTVYNYGHIGNFRTYIFEDVLRRTLEYLGYRVTHVQNVTDVGHLVSDGDDGEDKMVKAARLQQKDPWEIARFYEEAFIADEKKLNILAPHHRPRATEHIPAMVEMVQTLLDKGHAYETSDGIYFDISTFPDYFKLSKNNQEDLIAGKRIAVVEEKRNPGDFALWKKAEPNHIMQWEAFGFQGYPGWHLECSAMSIAYLGETFDIHCGGEDHIFPHHECEIAQSEATTGKVFANYWLHSHFMLVEGRKMSKSLENFFTIDDLERRGFTARDFRYLCLASHYRQNTNFTWDAMEQACNSLARLDTFIQQLLLVEREGGFSKAIEVLCRETMEDFMEAVEDDLNIPEALAVLFGLVKEVNILMGDENLMSSEARAILDLLRGFDSILGVLRFEFAQAPAEVVALAEERENARQEKDWSRSDSLRDAITALGWKIEDEREGYTLTQL